jgi:glutamate transport system ATP-binding protein
MAGGGAAPMIAIRGVNKHFGTLHVLRDVNLDVQRGQVVVVLGPSGSGKSTLCRTINRLETIDSGAIEIDGQSVSVEGRKLAQVRADVGMVFQSFNLFAHKTVLENVTLAPMKVRRAAADAARRRAMTLLDRVGVADQADKYPAQLSGGQQQRVAIARAIVTRPSTLFADEPTGNLDSVTTRDVMEILTRLNVDQGITVLLVTHEDGVAACARRTVLIRDGRVESDVSR